MSSLARRSALLLMMVMVAGCNVGDVSVDLGPAVTGTVTDAATNQGLPAVTVTVGGRQGITNPSGGFYISEVPRGVQAVIATKEGYVRYSGETTVSGDITNVKIAMVRQQ